MMPTTPQGVIAFYAANKLGAVAALIHPLSSSEEIGQALDATGARIALTLDAFYPALAAARPRLTVQHIILARLGDSLSPLKRLMFWRSEETLGVTEGFSNCHSRCSPYS